MPPPRTRPVGTFRGTPDFTTKESSVRHGTAMMVEISFSTRLLRDPHANDRLFSRVYFAYYISQIVACLAAVVWTAAAGGYPTARRDSVCSSTFVDWRTPAFHFTAMALDFHSRVLLLPFP